jgi:hypothetical protein
VVVRDLDIVGIAILPAKADTVLLVDADTMVAGTISFQAFQANEPEVKLHPS